MGGSCEMICCEPDTIIINFSLFTQDVIKHLEQDFFGLRMDDGNMETIITGKELPMYAHDCMKLYGYLGMKSYTQWKKFLEQLLQQNDTVSNIKLHFFDRCGCIPFYFKIDRDKGKNTVSMSTGPNFHILCTDVKELYGNYMQYIPELISLNIKKKRMIYKKKKETDDETKLNCIPFREECYEYEFNKKNYEKYYRLIKFKTEYFDDIIQGYMDKIVPINENDAMILVELFPYSFKIP